MNQDVDSFYLDDTRNTASSKQFLHVRNTRYSHITNEQFSRRCRINSSVGHYPASITVRLQNTRKLIRTRYIAHHILVWCWRDSDMGKRALVAGGCGFLGSHLCERLIEADYDVLCVDNYCTGSKSNVLHLLDDPRFELMRHDITLPLRVEVDEIFNLACPASPVHYQRDPIHN